MAKSARSLDIGMRDSERMAKVIIESLIPGAILKYRTTQSAGEYDFNLHFLMMRMDAVLCISKVVRRRFPAWLGAGKLKVL
jgi:hypothetical protein